MLLCALVELAVCVCMGLDRNRVGLVHCSDGDGLKHSLTGRRWTRYSLCMYVCITEQLDRSERAVEDTQYAVDLSKRVLRYDILWMHIEATILMRRCVVIACTAGGNAGWKIPIEG